MRQKTWVTKLYEWIKNLHSPKWFIDLTESLLKDVLVPAINSFVKQEIEFMIQKIKEQEALNIPGTEKAKNVMTAFRKTFSLNKATDSILNGVIGNLVIKYTTKF